jgi:hypothetical protein
MSRRNIWLSFPEWNLIRSELKTKNNNSFYLNEREIKEWKADIKRYSKLGTEEAQYCFERCFIYGLIDEDISPRVYNVLCRQNWRQQDMSRVMDYMPSFVGFVLIHVDDVDMDTTKEEWKHIQNEMLSVMDKTPQQRFWFYTDLIKLYKKVTLHQFEEQTA